MAFLKNTSKGLRGILLRNGERLWIEAGQSIKIASAAVKAKPADVIETDGSDLPQLANDPPALAGKNKAHLLEIAAAEGVTIEEGATNADIVAAIELGREG
jgi:hypothetical protein